MTETLPRFVEEAFKYVVAAEQLIYAAGMSREIKDDVLEAHSALLRLKNNLAAQERAA